MNCDYWGDYMWEVVAFVIIIVIGIFYLIGTYFGAGAVILVIGAIVFGFYKFLKSYTVSLPIWPLFCSFETWHPADSATFLVSSLSPTICR